MRAAIIAIVCAGIVTPVFTQDSTLTRVPSWAKRAVWYQIFPERFANGDTSNDPQLADIAGAWPHDTPSVWHVSRWTGDWYRLQPWEAADSAGNHGFYYQVQRRRYGGDIQGILDKLDYLSDLGVNALYLNPVFESPSLHKYDATMYHHIDNNFGPDPEGDRKIWASEIPSDPSTWKWTSADSLFLKLVREAHRRGMKIILDGVFNHVGMTFWAFRDARLNGERSRFKDWFTIFRYDDPATPRDEFDYQGWVGVKELPELRKDSANGIAHGPAEHIAAIVRRWMDPNGDGDPSDGIDGWRLDVADKVPLAFWRQFRTWVRGINPEAYITGEVWWEDWKNDKMFNAGPWLKGDAFDAVMNYRWAREVCHFFIDRKNAISAEELDRRLAALRSDYLTDVNFVLMNLLDSHDTDRLSSHIVNPDCKYDNHVSLRDNPAYDIRKPNAREREIQRLMALFQMAFLGAPMIYYGDETGMWGGDDPDERKPMLWPELKFDDEVSHPFGGRRPRDRNAADMGLHDWYRKIIRIRAANPALCEGEMKTVKADGDLYAFTRSGAGEKVLCAFNRGSAPRKLALGGGVLPWTNLLTGAMVKGDGTITLPPRTGALLLKGTK